MKGYYVFVPTDENGHASIPLSGSKVKIFTAQASGNFNGDVDKNLSPESMTELCQEKVWVAVINHTVIRINIQRAVCRHLINVNQECHS